MIQSTICNLHVFRVMVFKASLHHFIPVQHSNQMQHVYCFLSACEHVTTVAIGCKTFIKSYRQTVNKGSNQDIRPS